MRKITRFLTLICTLTTMSVFSMVIYVDSYLPQNFYIQKGEIFDIQNDNLTVSQVSPYENGVTNVTNSSTDAIGYDVNLFNIIPVKTIQVQQTEQVMLSPSGEPFGIKIMTEGVLVVGVSDVKTEIGDKSPTQIAGIKMGDIIVSINGEKVESNGEIAKIVKGSNGEPLKIEFIGDNSNKTTTIKPLISSEDGEYKIGMWVRDSSAGVGTMTFTDYSKGVFAGLGHGVCDVDTGEVLPVRKGEIVDVEILGVEKSVNGTPGQLQGAFKSTRAIGELIKNTEIGVYGTLSRMSSFSNESIPMAFKQEVKKGDAQIMTTIEGGEPELYDIDIEKINFNSEKSERNMVIKITDEELLAKTGGIVQGMSGSPIIQDGKIVGAVTHVFVNDTQQGYGIFAENMYNITKTL